MLELRVIYCLLVTAASLVGGFLPSLVRLTHIRVHGDCHGGNILWGPDGPAFVDLDDSRMAPAVQDLWMFLEGNDDERRGQLFDLLEGYEAFRSFDFREIRVIEALRALRRSLP